jgi:hypothetical protein
MSTTNKTQTLNKKKTAPKSQIEIGSEEVKKDLMKGIVAFVDVKAEGIETSDAISKKIEEYGGKVNLKLF